MRNWSHALDPSFGLPPDVAFKIIENNGGEEKTIMAHKYFLAMVSPVFKEMFFGETRLTGDVVPIINFSLEAFTLMIEYIYQKDINWFEKTVPVMIQMLDLADMYGLKRLLEELQLCW